MLCQRLSALFSADQSSVVKDVLSGKERILPLVDVRRYPCRTLSACHFAAMNFVRVAFKYMTMQRTRGGSSPSMARWLSALMERRGFEDMLSPCEALTSEQSIRLDEMRRVPLFEDTLRHVTTKHGHPSMILFKQSLRQMQLHGSPVSAIVVSRNASATVCLKVRENSKDVFLVLDFALAPQAHGHSATLALVVGTSLEQMAARLSGNLPMGNHLVTRDRQWQAQLFTSCTICMFTPAERVALSTTESAMVRESVALLRIMGGADDQGRGWEVGRDGGANRDPDRTGRQGNHPSRPSISELPGRTPWDVSRIATTSRDLTSGVVGRSIEEGASTHLAELGPKTTFIPYEQTKRHCRIFFSDDDESSPATTPSSPSLWCDASNEETDFECVICFENIPEAERIRLLPCAHGFCRDCLAGHVCSKIEERKHPVFCPLCMTEQENASPTVVSGEIVQRLKVSEAQYTIWSDLEMAQWCVRVHCHRCDRPAFINRENYEQSDEVNCPLPGCGHTWCKNCQQSLSGDGRKHSCDGTEELNELVKRMGWKYCPKCRTPVQKNGGCNHMTCGTPGCSTHFCYRCGKQITRASIPFLVRSAVNAHFKQCTL